jgi:MATE family multidrug resistance protein
MLLFGTLSSINVLISHQYGARNYNVIAQIFRDGILLAILLAVPAFILFWNMSSIFILLGQNPVLVPIANAYLHALSWGILPTFIMIALFEFIMGLGHTRIIMFFTIFSVTVGIFCSYGLIFGAFGFPALGIAGSGWGLTISNFLTASFTAVYIFTNKNYSKYVKEIFHLQKPKFLRELIHVGMPMGAMYCLEVGFFFCLSLILGFFGSKYLAANQITLQYMTAFMGAVIFPIAQAVTVRMGHFLGADNMNDARKTNRVGVFLSGSFMVTIAFVYWFLPDLLIKIDLDMNDPKNQLIIATIKQFLIVCAFFQFFESLRISLFGALRAFKDTRFSLLTSVITFWIISLPVGYFLSLWTGGVGMWWGMTLGAITGVILLVSRYKYLSRSYDLKHQLI